MAVDILPKRDIVEVIIPNNANGTGVTPGNSWAYSAWAQIVASSADNYILVGVYANVIISATTATVANLYQFEIGTGAAASEVTIGRTGGAIGHSTSAGAETKSILKSELLWLPPTRIASGTRISVRATKSTTDATVLNVSLVCYPASSWPAILEHPQPENYMRGMEDTGAGGLALPAAGVSTVTTAGSLWVYGTWVNVIAAGARTRPLLITGLAAGGLIVNGGFHAQIGLGAAGSEIAHGVIPFSGRAGLPGPGFGTCYLPRPIFVKPGEEVSLSIRGRPINQAFDMFLLMHEVK